MEGTAVVSGVVIMVFDLGMQKRLTAVLVADVCNYTGLMEQDEFSTHKLYRELNSNVIQNEIANYNGRQVKSTGDGFVAGFESVVDCLNCAQEIQTKIDIAMRAVAADKQIRFRMGINVGDVIDEGHDIYGEAVNLAARLQEQAAPGGICVSEAVYLAAKDKVDASFRAAGTKQFKNISPVNVYRIAPLPRGLPLLRNLPGGRFVQYSSAGVLALALSATVLWLLPQQRAALRNALTGTTGKIQKIEARSVAVLAFDNLTGDRNQDYLTEGLAGDVITKLSQLKGLFVISRRSSFSYRGNSKKAPQIATELGVRYILEGSLRREGKLFNINAGLVDSQTGRIVWTRDFKTSEAGVIKLQDSVAKEVAAFMALRFSPRQDTGATSGTLSFAAYDAFLRGWNFYQAGKQADNWRAITYFKTAVRLDPSYGRSHAALGMAYIEARVNGWPAFKMQDTDRIRTSATSSLADVHSNHQKNMQKASYHLAQAKSYTGALTARLASHVHLLNGDHNKALTETQKSLRLDPNDPDNIAHVARLYLWLGEAAKAKETIARAIRADPKNTNRYMDVAGTAAFIEGKYAKAANLLAKNIKAERHLIWPIAHLIAALAHDDKIVEARKQYALLNKRLIESGRPAYQSFEARRRIPYKYESDRWRLVLGLSIAEAPK